jgi:hypothetical protein
LVESYRASSEAQAQELTVSHPPLSPEEAEIRALLAREEARALARLRSRVLAAVALYSPEALPNAESDAALLEAHDELAVDSEAPLCPRIEPQERQALDRARARVLASVVSVSRSRAAGGTR